MVPRTTVLKDSSASAPRIGIFSAGTTKSIAATIPGRYTGLCHCLPLARSFLNKVLHPENEGS